MPQQIRVVIKHVYVMWRTSSASCKESQFQFMNRIRYSSPHMFGLAASAYSLDYAHAFGVELVWQCQWFFETTTTGLDCIALFLRPLGKHQTWVYTSEAKPCLDTKLFDACLQTKRTLQTHILQTLPTTLPWKTLLNRSGQRHAKTKTKEKKHKHGESPAMLAEWKQSPNWGKHIGHSWKAKLSKLSKCIIVLTSETTRTRASVCILILSQLILRPLRIRCTAIAFCNSSQTACSAKQLR